MNPLPPPPTHTHTKPPYFPYVWEIEVKVGFYSLSGDNGLIFKPSRVLLSLFHVTIMFYCLSQSGELLKPQGRKNIRK